MYFCFSLPTFSFLATHSSDLGFPRVLRWAGWEGLEGETAPPPSAALGLLIFVVLDTFSWGKFSFLAVTFPTSLIVFIPLTSSGHGSKNMSKRFSSKWCLKILYRPLSINHAMQASREMWCKQDEAGFVSLFQAWQWVLVIIVLSIALSP